MGASWEGFLAAGIAVLGFGSNFVPVKKFETGDGMFFQWVLCCAVWMTGLVIQLWQDSPEFQPIAMVGGIIWCTGNLMVVPIIKCIGLGLGLLIWGLSSLVMGWATGNFGLFGLHKNTVENPWLNYAGFGLAIVSVVIYAFIKPSIPSKRMSESEESTTKTEEIEYSPINSSASTVPQDDGTSWVDHFSPLQRRCIGLVLSIFSGLCYGSNFDPPQWLIDNHKGSSSSLDYVFSHFSGIILASTFYFFLYCILKKNKPCLYPEAILPGFISGVLWAIAQIAFFVANQELSFVVSFPIISTGPGAIGSLWGVLLFQEIKGKLNIAVLLLAISINVVAVVLIALSQLSL